MINTTSSTYGDTTTARLPDMTMSGRLLQRIRAEFIEMPGLMLTLRQATRLWSLTAPQAQAALTELVDAGVLVRDPKGIYRRLGSSGPEPDDRVLDEILDETFPASDPPANTVETGIRIDAQPAGGPDGCLSVSR